MVGDIILVNKFIYGPRLPFVGWRLPGFRKPQTADVVVFIYPEDPKKNFIKRLVAKEADTVLIENGTIYVNDKPLTENVFSRNFYYNHGNYAREGEKITVPKGSYFVLGDNSANSQDSRFWGFVPQGNILGKAILIYWPLNRIRAIK